MLPCLQETLDHLNAAFERARAEFEAASARLIIAESHLDAARDRWIFQRDILKLFIEYTDRESKGGAS